LYVEWCILMEHPLLGYTGSTQNLAGCLSVCINNYLVGVCTVEIAVYDAEVIVTRHRSDQVLCPRQRTRVCC